MTRIIHFAVALGLGLSSACDSKTDDGKKADAKKADAKVDAKKPEDKKPEDKKPDAAAPDAKAEPEPVAAADVETDLSPWGPEFAGWVAMAPAGTKVELDDPSRQMTISEDDYLSVGEAPGYEDMVKGLSGDADNSNIQVVSPTEARWERNPPLGKEWNFDVKIDLGGKPWSCSGSTFTDAATADKLVAICKSMKKK